MYRLRELERKDLLEIYNWRNDVAVINYLGAPFRYINLEVDEKWFDSYMCSRNNCVRCAIFLLCLKKRYLEQAEQKYLMLLQNMVLEQESSSIH